MAEAGKGQVHLGLPEEASTQWPLQRYGRFMLPDVGEQLGPDTETEAASAPTWKVMSGGVQSAGGRSTHHQEAWTTGTRKAGTGGGRETGWDRNGEDSRKWQVAAGISMVMSDVDNWRTLTYAEK